MNHDEIISSIKTRNWYRQGGAICLYHTSFPYRAAFSQFGGFNFYVGDKNYGYFDKDKEKEFADAIVVEQLNDADYFENTFILPWRKMKLELLSFTPSITTERLKKLNEEEFLLLHKKLCDLRMEIWKPGIIIEAFDPWGDQMLTEYVRERNLCLSSEDMGILTGPHKRTYLQNEELDRLKLALLFKENGLESINELLVKHIQKYYWLQNSWGHFEMLTENYFLPEIEKDAKLSIDEIKKKIADLDSFETKCESKKGELIKKYELTKEDLAFFNLFAQMTDWRDERKTVAMKANIASDLFLRELSSRIEINWKYLCQLEVLELTSFSDVKQMKSELIERSKGVFYFLDANIVAPQMVTGDLAIEYHELLVAELSKSDEIKGMVANQGTVSGTVKVVITKDEFGKVEDGDILVTQMTRPEFMPILTRVAGIITDEGGITCHAAIVSRELGIPCVIGTQVATQKLKDGDLVRIENGIVTKQSC